MFLFLVIIANINRDKSDQNKDHFDTLKNIGESNNIQIYYVTLFYASLLKLFRLAVRQSSIKQEVKEC